MNFLFNAFFYYSLRFSVSPVCVCVCVGKASGFNISVPMLLDSTGKPSKKLGRHRICMGDPWQVSRWWSDF